MHVQPLSLTPVNTGHIICSMLSLVALNEDLIRKRWYTLQ